MLSKTGIFSFFTYAFLIISFTCSQSIAFSQTKLGYYPVSEIKKKDGKWGIKAGRDWVLNPGYDSIKLVGYQARHGRYAVFYGWKSGKLDVFDEKSLSPILSNSSIDDTIHIASFAVFYSSETKPFLENKLVGWKHKQAVVVKPEFDSIRLGYDPRREIYFEDINVYKNGQMGLMSKDGRTLIPLGDYEDIGSYLPGYTSIFGKPGPSGERLMGFYFDKNKMIPPIYTSVVYETNVTLNGIYINPSSTDIPGFYNCQLPNGNADYYVNRDTGIARLPEALAKTFHENKIREATAKKLALEAEAAKRKWVNGLVLFAKGGAVGIKDSSGNIILPAQATALEFGRFSIDPDGDTIHIRMLNDDDKDMIWFRIGTMPVTVFMSEYENISKFAIKAELNPYNSLTGDYKSYFDGDINARFNYKSGFALYDGICPLCDGDGKLYDGYTLSSETFTYDRVVKDGTTTISRKNYLANERVDANGKVYIPTYTQTYDNYKTVKEEKKVVTRTNKYKTCTLCEGKKKYKFAFIVWDDKRTEYVLTTLTF